MRRISKPSELSNRGSRRSGHIEFLVMLSCVTIICMLFAEIILAGPGKDWSHTTKMIVRHINPGIWFGYLAFLVWGVILGGLGIECPAHYIGVGVSQYDRRRLLGVPRWVISRGCLLGFGFCATAFLIRGMGYTFDQVLEFSFWKIQLFGLVTFVWTVLLTWILAYHKSGYKLEPIFAYPTKPRSDHKPQ